MALMVVITLGGTGIALADGPEKTSGTAQEKVDYENQQNAIYDAKLTGQSPQSQGAMTALAAARVADFYLDATYNVPYNGSYSSVGLSSGWDTTCGWWACGNTITYEYTNTVWHGHTPYNAYSMQLSNKWKQNGLGVTFGSCSLGWPRSISCTVSGTSSKTINRTGRLWYNLWSVYDEFFEGTVQFGNFLVLASLNETATSFICYYPGQCQTFQAYDSQ